MSSRIQKSNCPKIILNAIPSNCTEVSFSNLDPDNNYENKALIGKIKTLFPIGKRANGYIRKLLVTDAIEEDQNDQMKLTIFLLNDFAKDSEAAEEGGFIILTNFHLEKSTHCRSNEYPLQALVNTENSQVLFARKVSKVGVGKKPKTTKKVCCTDEESDFDDIPPKKTKKNEPQAVQINPYDYVPIEELKETAEKETFNIYAVVDKSNLKVVQGKRTQILELLLTDETQTGFICAIFAAKDEMFPDVYPGDIVRVHRMQVQKFRNRLKGKCPSSKFILVFSKSNQGDKPRTVAKSFTFTTEDGNRVKSLFNWYNKKNEPKLINELLRGDFANIICQVIAVYCAKTTDAVILKIWDGTKTSVIESSHYGFREENIDEKLFLTAKNYYVVLSVYGEHAASAIQLQPQQYIEVRDAHVYSSSLNPDDCKLCLHTGNVDGRGITVLCDDDDRVIKLKERLDQVATETNGNETADLLSQNNSIFLNCDISSYAPTQKETIEENNSDMSFLACGQKVTSIEDNIADIEALNTALTTNNVMAIDTDNEVVSVINAAIKPGESTQQFSEGMLRDLGELNNSVDNNTQTSSQLDPVLNKTPLEFKMFLHNPTGQPFPPPELQTFQVNNRTEDGWWKNIETVSETDGHSDVKPSSLLEVEKHTAPYKFRVFSAVLSYKPATNLMTDLIRLICPDCYYISNDAMPRIDPFEERDGLFYFYCPICFKKVEKTNCPVLEYTFMLSLNLHDGETNNLEAILMKEKAIQFFKGFTPEAALQNKHVTDSIFQMLWSICPNCKPLDSTKPKANEYPILDCCILSYNSDNGIVYEIFDTIMK